MRYKRNIFAAAVGMAMVFIGGCAASAGSGGGAVASGAHAEPPGAGAGLTGGAEQTQLAAILRAHDNAAAQSPARKPPAAHLRSQSEADHAPISSSTQPTSQPSTALTPPTSSSAPPAGPQYAVAGMIGQVNGQAIYADKVFKPMEAQLTSLATRLSRQQFAQRARQLISNRLQQMVADRLILGQAMRDLTPAQQQALNYYVRQHRQQLVREYGRGSLALAQQNIVQQTGKTLERSVEDFRQTIVVRQYLRVKLLPRINVTRLDVRRYYHNHDAQFNPPTVRTLRLIRTGSAADAAEVAKQLAAGQSFAKVAGSSLNTYNRDDGGMMGEQQGDQVLRGKLNSAMLKLNAGQYAGPAEVGGQAWFVYVQSMKKPQGQSLRDAQLKIEQHLRDEQFRKLSADYRQKLFKQGSYNTISQMTDSLMKIAMSRYAPTGSGK